MTFIHGLDELVPDTAAGKRAASRQREAKRAAGEASRARSAATLEQRQREYKATRGRAQGWRETNGTVVMNPGSTLVATAGSWWLDVPADQFAQRAAAEQDRMQGSKFGGKTTAVATDMEES